jgi:hypothetical protein
MYHPFGKGSSVVVYRTVPRIQGCSPAFTNLNKNQPFKELAEAYSGPPRTMKLQMLCGETASHYAATFNRTLATIKPEALHGACAAGQLEAQ